MQLTFDFCGWSFKSYWCRIAVNEKRDFNRKEHSHSFFELHLCLQGESDFDVEGESYTLKSGHYLLLNRNKKHTILSVSSDFEKFVWGFEIASAPDQHLLDSFSEGLDKQCYFQYDEKYTEILDLIVEDVGKRPFAFTETIKVKLHLLFMELFRAVSKQSRKNAASAAEKDIRMSVIENFIKDNILADVSVDDIVSEFALCKKQLSRICQKNYGMTIVKFITKLKIEKAKELLEKTDYSLLEISDMLCFSDKYAFGRVFKREEGLSPIKFRNSIKL